MTNRESVEGDLTAPEDRTGPPLLAIGAVLVAALLFCVVMFLIAG